MYKGVEAGDNPPVGTPLESPREVYRIITLQKAEGLLTVLAPVHQEILPKRCNKDTKLDSAMELDELQEFNNLKYKNGISGIKRPVISASLTAAASSNHRLHSGTVSSNPDQEIPSKTHH
ncbi:hypothetical protein VP01_12822g1 [Puccinia sorghi]|uniref:Uncharacterized protein n=1 Tax=Puccinia sorghi TaxID=27349 RepID=A0A0L6VNZ8_9BASI|nr:hypothetical protein VP01_12822g1 [Puccinia sorghi]